MWHSGDRGRSGKQRSSLAKLAHLFGFGDVPSPAPPCFALSSSSAAAIGLGIVAAMDAPGPPVAAPAIPTPAVASPTADEVELSESSGCPVESRQGGDCGGILVDGVVLFELPTPGELVPQPSREGELLRRCFRCEKELDGLDVYMYRGEKAFCSSECRCHHLLLEELKSQQHSLPPCSAPPPLAAEVLLA